MAGELYENAVNADSERLELLGLLRSELDDSLVEELAAWDGGMDKEQNLQAFAEILQTGRIPCPLEGNPADLCLAHGLPGVILPHGMARWLRLPDPVESEPP